jgi:hypothetical protein
MWPGWLRTALLEGQSGARAARYFLGVRFSIV